MPLRATAALRSCPRAVPPPSRNIAPGCGSFATARALTSPDRPPERQPGPESKRRADGSRADETPHVSVPTSTRPPSTKSTCRLHPRSSSVPISGSAASTYFDGLVKRVGSDDGLVLLHAALFSTRQHHLRLADGFEVQRRNPCRRKRQEPVEPRVQQRFHVALVGGEPTYGEFK